MRTYIILTLDDPNGISQDAFDELKKVCEYANDYNENFDDIIALVQFANGRCYLPEDHGL